MADLAAPPAPSTVARRAFEPLARRAARGSPGRQCCARPTHRRPARFRVLAAPVRRAAPAAFAACSASSLKGAVTLSPPTPSARANPVHVVEVLRRERQVHGIDASGAERRVVHRRGHRMRDGPPGHAVIAVCAVSRRNPYCPMQQVRRHLARRHRVARVRPGVAKPRRQDARRDARLAHREEHVPPLRAPATNLPTRRGATGRTGPRP